MLKYPYSVGQGGAGFKDVPNTIEFCPCSGYFDIHIFGGAVCHSESSTKYFKTIFIGIVAR